MLGAVQPSELCPRSNPSQNTGNALTRLDERRFSSENTIGATSLAPRFIAVRCSEAQQIFCSPFAKVEKVHFLRGLEAPRGAIAKVATVHTDARGLTAMRSL